MTPEEITKLAKSLCATSNPTQDDVWLIEDIIDGILRTHCIVSKEKVKEEYQKALNQIAGGRGYDIPRIESYGTGKRKVLESRFDVETFKNSET